MRFRTKTILGIAAIEMALLAVLIGSALQILRDSNEEELTRRVTLGGKLLAGKSRRPRRACAWVQAAGLR